MLGFPLIIFRMFFNYQIIMFNKYLSVIHTESFIIIIS